jgi:DNA-binding CsgD family transcriptional regulator/tetratricopeptide (TPR) repeat protein
MAPLPASFRLVPSYPFAGRSRELGALRALLPRAEGEGRRAALVTGDAGSGKSRLVRELAHELAADDVLVLYGACDAVVRAPYGAIVEALEQLVRQHDEPAVRAALTAAGPELVRLLPDLAETVGPLADRRSADPDTERHRLHGAVVDVLVVAGRVRPVLLVLDDVHWADASTLLLVRHLVRSAAEARMLLVATCRDAEPDAPDELSQTLVDVQRAEGVARMRLGGLSEDEVADFVRLAAGVAASPDVPTAIAELTGGSPFLVTELWRELVESDAVAVDADGARLLRPLDTIATPEPVRAVVGQRLARLEPEVARLLELAAIAGSEFELAVLRRAAALAESDLLDAIDGAVRSGMLVEVPAHGLAYRFAHELVRRALADRPGAARRAELHLRIADALEAVTAGSAGPRDAQALADLAYHFTAAAAVGGTRKAVFYNVLAGEAASAALAFDEAVERLWIALELGIEDARERARVTLELGDACQKGGRSADALAAFSQVAVLARELDDTDLLALAAIGFEEACWRPGIVDAGAAELLEEAAEACERESGVRVRVLGGLARALDFRGEHDRAALVRDEAIRIARERGARRELAAVLAASYWSRGTSSTEQILAMLTEARSIGEELGDAEIRAEATSWRVPAFVALCDHDAARRELADLFEVAALLHEPFRQHVAEHYASALALCDGDLAGAEAAALRSQEWSRLLTGRDASGIFGVQMFSIRREQGRLAELAPLVRVLAADRRDGSWRPGLVVLLAELGMEEEARRELTHLAGDGLDVLRPSLWLASLTYLADACATLADERLAAIVYEELLPHAGSNVMVGHLVTCYGAADRYLGSISAVLGEWEQAERHFESALELNRRLRARTWVARTAFEYARMLLTRRARDDRSRAAALLGEAAALADVVGMHSLTAQIGSLGLGWSAAHAVSLPDDLSPREVEVLRLVARGLSNRDIGSELTISEHTAANHVRSILRKTGTANRTEAASYAHRRGLVPS